MTSVAAKPDRRAALLEAQRRVMEGMAAGAGLEETLSTLVALIEEQAGGARCAVLLADARQRRLYYAAAPNIPDDYKRGVEPLMSIAPDTGTCGAAAFLRRPVYTRDITTDPQWRHCAEIATRNGLRAIWSTPILSDAGAVLGTFAMHYGEPRLPSEDDMRLIDMAVQLARLAIEAKSDGVLRELLESAPDGILVTDLGGSVLWANRRFATMLGYEPGDLRGRNVADFAEAEDQPPRIPPILHGNGEDISRSMYYRSKTGARLWARERWTVRRDAAGEPRYVLVRVRKMTEAGSDPLERLTRREREVLDLVIAGYSSREIGAQLGIAAASVDTYRSRLMVKLGVEDLAGLVLFAVRSGVATV